MHGFISYAHEDLALFREFRKHLTPVERAFEIDFWADTRLQPGTVWRDEIGSRIDAAQIFVLLVSPAFLASDFIYKTELPAIQARRAADPDVLVLPVVLMKCFWKMVAADRQAVPMRDGALRPVIDWRPRNDGFDAARAALGDAIETHTGQAPIYAFR